MKNVCELCQLYSPSGCAKLSNESCLKEAVQLLKDNVTNGDALKAMFPSIENRLDERTGIMLVKWADGTGKAFKTSWWNAPYKAGVEE